MFISMQKVISWELVATLLIPVDHSFKYNTNINFDEGHIKFDVLSKNYPSGNFLFKCNICINVPCVFKSKNSSFKIQTNCIAPRNWINLKRDIYKCICMLCVFWDLRYIVVYTNHDIRIVYSLKKIGMHW